MSLQQQFEKDRAEEKPLYQTLGQSRLPVDDKPSFYEEKCEVKLSRTPDFVSTIINSKINGGEEIKLDKWFNESRRNEMLALPDSKYHLILKYDRLVSGRLTREYVVKLITPELLQGILLGMKRHTLFSELFHMYPQYGTLKKIRIGWLE